MSEDKAEYITQDDEKARGKPLRCPECRQVVGYVIRRNGIRTLRVELGGMAVETGFEMDVWCTCGGLLHWHAGQEAIDELIRKVTQRGEEKNGISGG
jgi:hypothetical protein